MPGPQGCPTGQLGPRATSGKSCDVLAKTHSFPRRLTVCAIRCAKVASGAPSDPCSQTSLTRSPCVAESSPIWIGYVVAQNPRWNSITPRALLPSNDKARTCSCPPPGPCGTLPTASEPASAGRGRPQQRAGFAGRLRLHELNPLSAPPGAAPLLPGYSPTLCLGLPPANGWRFRISSPSPWATSRPERSPLLSRRKMSAWRRFMKRRSLAARSSQQNSCA